jgi:hypothetical protein
MAEAQSIFIPKISPGDLASLDYWTPNDAIFPERGTGVTASTERTQSVGNRPVLLFPAPSDEGDTAAVLFDGSMGEDYGGGIITFDIYWFPETGAAGDVCLTLLLVRENPGILFDPLVPTVPFKSVVVAAPGTSLEIQKAPESDYLLLQRRSRWCSARRPLLPHLR